MNTVVIYKKGDIVAPILKKQVEDDEMKGITFYKTSHNLPIKKVLSIVDYDRLFVSSGAYLSKDDYKNYYGHVAMLPLYGMTPKKEALYRSHGIYVPYFSDGYQPMKLWVKVLKFEPETAKKLEKIGKSITYMLSNPNMPSIPMRALLYPSNPYINQDDTAVKAIYEQEQDYVDNTISRAYWQSSKELSYSIVTSSYLMTAVADKLLSTVPEELNKKAVTSISFCVKDNFVIGKADSAEKEKEVMKLLGVDDYAITYGFVSFSVPGIESLFPRAIKEYLGGD